ncbi:COP23 domain-containing protein [Crocosphaera sp.]|uniref:COP23 domain-containing protein n=1 Tax=Crocosphaera sp. TaxID=2729996 RepID=UPI00263753E9|nr:COP23 domain-containing protein [Crocosphaera sp.]MDJ0581642.1 COP23 domain-containing protein [Crocosphaera sp.]
MNNKYYQLCWGLLLGVLFCGFFRSDSQAFSPNLPITSQLILNQENKYFCDQTQDHPILIGRSDLGNVEIIIFQNPLGDSTPAQRCQVVAERFNNLVFSYLSWTRTPQGERVIIATKYEGVLFRSEDNIHLLFELKEEDTVHDVLESLNGILSSNYNGSKKNIKL